MTTRRRWLTSLVLGGLLVAWLPWCCTAAWAGVAHTASGAPAGAAAACSSLHPASPPDVPSRGDSGCMPARDDDDSGRSDPSDCGQLTAPAYAQTVARGVAPSDADDLSADSDSPVLGALPAGTELMRPHSAPADRKATQSVPPAVLYLAYCSFLE